MSGTEDTPERDDAALQRELSAALAVPELDAGLSQRTQRAARAAAWRPGEGTLSWRGLGHAWSTAGLPALLVIAGLAYTYQAWLQLLRIFVGQ